jgi:hypothetical protein
MNFNEKFVLIEVSVKGGGRREKREGGRRREKEGEGGRRREKEGEEEEGEGGRV